MPDFSEISGREGGNRQMQGWELGAFKSHTSGNSGCFPPRQHLHCQKGRCFILGDNACSL